jgi:endogenous inhibitor of DNA gyrase (YacG/DUF329 family)
MAKEELQKCKYCKTPLYETDIVGTGDTILFTCSKCKKINFGKIEEYTIEIEEEKDVSTKKRKKKN